MNERKYSETIALTINDFLTEDDWHYSFDDKRGIFKFGLSLKGKLKSLSYIINVREDDYVVYAISPIGADADDEKMMANISAFVCRANYGIVNGNFELDMQDGEVRFKSFVDCEDIIPSREMISNSIYCPAAMFKHYGAGIVDIIFSGSTAKEAVERCEKTTKDEIWSSLSGLFSDDSEGNGDLSDMIARLAERLGHTDEPDSAPTDVAEESTHIKTDLFSTEGDAE